MNCELISVGTEILLGDILNTNAQYLSKELASLGIGVTHQCTVGDNRERLLSAIDLAFSRCEMIIFTGGLGPTPDDLTKEVCSEYFGKELLMDEAIAEDIRKYFKDRNRTMPESNLKQALVPKDATVLYNTCGTAPGFIMEKDGKTMIILPGPPNEMTAMFRKSVRPFLSEKSDCIIKSHTVRTFGIGESDMSERVRDLLFMENPTVAPYAKSGEALLRVTAKAESEEKADGLMKDVISEIESRLGDYIYGIDVSSTEEALSKILKEKKMTVSFAESCTGGLCGKRMTDLSGASQIFHCGVISYSNEIKEKVLSVKKEHLTKYGAVSAVVAAEMAEGVRLLSSSSIGVSVTGEAGPTSGDGKPVGLIYIAVTDGERLLIKELHGRTGGDNCREYNRIFSASAAFNAAQTFIKGSVRSESLREFIESH
ncbi:MAG: competence/damage-inducible protein A [Clostridia bacterium]|nr:competence/damage-inducible protein A [Clostridia bacterium]